MESLIFKVLTMVLDIDLFREEKGGNPKLIYESEKKRFRDVKHVDNVIKFDVQWRQSMFSSNFVF